MAEQEASAQPSNPSTRKGSQPALFDSNSAERRIRLVYEKHAPEKISKVAVLLSRYRGYEECAGDESGRKMQPKR